MTSEYPHYYYTQWYTEWHNLCSCVSTTVSKRDPTTNNAKSVFSCLIALRGENSCSHDLGSLQQPRSWQQGIGGWLSLNTEANKGLKDLNGGDDGLTKKRCRVIATIWTLGYEHCWLPRIIILDKQTVAINKFDSYSWAQRKFRGSEIKMLPAGLNSIALAELPKFK